MNYFFNPKAQVEQLEHMAYLKSLQQGLGAFYLALAARTKFVLSAATATKSNFPNIWRYRVSGFLYNILYLQAHADVEALVCCSALPSPG